MSNNLTDTDKFKMVFEESKLNQTKFASMINITPGSLSGILSGRTKPTMALFRSISQAFPNINPMWLFADDPNMHIGDTAQVSPQESTTQNNDLFDQGSFDDSMFAFGDLGKSAAEGLSHNTQQSTPSAPVVNNRDQSSNRSSGIPSSHVSSAPDPNTRQQSKTVTVDPEVLATKVAMKLQKPARQITEIRIFFDDGTYETFGPHS